MRSSPYSFLTVFFTVGISLGLFQFQCQFQACDGYRTAFFNRRHPLQENTREKAKILPPAPKSKPAPVLDTPVKIGSPAVLFEKEMHKKDSSKLPFLRQDYKLGNVQFPPHTKGGIVGSRGRKQDLKMRGRRHVICKSHWSKCDKSTDCCSGLCHNGHCMYPHMK